MNSPRPNVATVIYGGIATTMFINNKEDYVQREIDRGKFYEENQLERHRSMIPYSPGKVIVDIGANIGNHSLFYARHTMAERVIPFEANPIAAQLLKASVQENKLENRIDLSHLEIAVSNVEGQVQIGSMPENNLGATRVEPVVKITTTSDAPKMVVSCNSLDSLLGGSRATFIKIDVEGHEMLVLEGAQKTIDTCRPSLAIEVNRVNEKSFWQWMNKNAYACVDFFHDYEGVRNYCIIPKS